MSTDFLNYPWLAGRTARELSKRPTRELSTMIAFQASKSISNNRLLPVRPGSEATNVTMIQNVVAAPSELHFVTGGDGHRTIVDNGTHRFEA